MRRARPPIAQSSRPRGRPSLGAWVLLPLAALCWPREAEAFCRTTTAQTPADYDPSVSGCWSSGLPLFWANACVSYDIQQAASRQISYDDASKGIAKAFLKWTGAACASSDGTTSRPSIDVRDFGPVACNLVQYDQTGPNQHVIIFSDTEWPYDDSSNMLALTTVTYDKLTGEIYDADMEINTHDQTLSVSIDVPTGGYDYESIVTHETGHFLGMAHATDAHATMYAHYSVGMDTMRALAVDDTQGICSIYSPDGLRHVARAASPSGTVPEGACDPTPRHGFTSQCMSSGSACGMSPRRDSRPVAPVVGVAGWAALIFRGRRRRCRETGDVRGRAR
jgi:hypothetical protein